jgi:hypothetical protein
MATLDEVLNAVKELTSTPILFAAREEILYQPDLYRKGSPIIGRPRFQHHVLLVHPRGADNGGTWKLPDTLDIAGDVLLPNPVPYGGDALLVEVDRQFKPTLGDGGKYDDSAWLHPDYASQEPSPWPQSPWWTAYAKENGITHWVHPSASKTITRFAKAQRYAVITPHDKPGDFMDRQPFLDAQVKVQAVADAFGNQTPPSLSGETLAGYWARLLRPYQPYSRFKNSDLSRIDDAPTLSAIANEICDAAMKEAEHPTQYAKGELRAVVRNDSAGRPITRYYGDPNACWDQFNPQTRFARIITPGSR